MSRKGKQPRCTLDFETRSECDLRKHGGYRYAKDPTTEVLVFAYRLPTWTPGRTEIWTPEYPNLGVYRQGGDFDALFELFDWLATGGLVEAHNAQFDRQIWEHIMVPQYSWPEIPRTQWRCSAAQAAACALPRRLDDALAAMRLAMRKDATGAKVMMKMTKPRKARKAERESWADEHGNKPMHVLYHEDRHLLKQLFDYVRQDVLAEEALSYVVPDLSQDELEMYWLDQAMNDRGFQLDIEAVDAALYLLQEESIRLNAELRDLTGGAVERATQRDRMKAWLASEGLELDDTQAATLDDLLEKWPASASFRAQRAITILRTLGRSSTSKYEAMSKWADLSTGRVHGGLLYHGASTGRWTGAGVQPQNFPKGTLKAHDDENPDAFVERLWDVLKTLDRETIIAAFGASVTEVLSHALRSAIVARDGYELYCVAPETKILTADLQWVRADEVASGLEIIGFDECSGTGKGRQRKFRPSQVVDAKRVSNKRRVLVRTTHGNILVSDDHQFLARQHKRRGGWTEARDLKPGDQLAFLTAPWEKDDTRDGGYLAGILDGEGHLTSHAVGWAQNPGKVWDRVCDLMWDRGFHFLATVSNGSPVQKAQLIGGLGEQLRLLGSLRPERLLAGSQRVWNGRRIWGQETPIVTVLCVEPAPDGDVIAIETTTHTLITDGFLSHNCADYASIEARVLLWLAGDEEALNVFKQGKDIYCYTASELYGRPITKADTKERQLGKALVLACGYQMGAPKFKDTAAKQGIELSDEQAAEAVDAYRRKYWRTKQLWFDTEATAIQCVKTKRPVECGQITWLYENEFLWCELPSGRRLAYPFPWVSMQETAWGSQKETLQFKTVNPKTRQWGPQKTYGGMLTENITQAVSRDLIAAALKRLEAHPVYEPILSVHDEAIAEAPIGKGDVHEFEGLVAELPEWAEGIPVAAEGYRASRYRK